MGEFPCSDVGVDCGLTARLVLRRIVRRQEKRLRLPDYKLRFHLSDRVHILGDHVPRPTPIQNTSFFLKTRGPHSIYKSL